MRRIGLVVALVALGACTKKDPLFCDGSHACTDPARPFCDVNGEFAASDGIKNTCIAAPYDAGVDAAPACQASTSVCTAGEWKQCDATGSLIVDEICSLGCNDTADGCKQVVSVVTDCPAFVGDARTAPPIDLANQSVIDTTTGKVTTGGVDQNVDFKTVACSFGNIRVLAGRSVTLHDVTVTGTDPLVIVSWDAMNVDGHLDARGRGPSPGPGDPTCPSLLVDVGWANDGSSMSMQFPGGGGGGLGSAGNVGGDNNGASGGIGGSMQTWGPSDFGKGGGCPGGNVTDGSTVLFRGGGGGGAVALISNTAIEINAAAGTGTGVVDVGGGGGERGAGGGSGGFALLEAPVIDILGTGAGVAANGGSGGSWCPNGGAEQGGDGKPSTDSADVATCAGAIHGGTGTPALGPSESYTGSAVPSYAGGGGGGFGQIVLWTTSGDVTLGSGAFLSGQVQKATLATK